MNNFEIICSEFIADTYGNRPKNAHGTIISYTEEERSILKSTVQHHIHDIETHKDEISPATYELLATIYNLVYKQLINKQI